MPTSMWNGLVESAKIEPLGIPRNDPWADCVQADVQMMPPKSFRELRERYSDGERDFTGAELDEDPDCDLSGICLDGSDFSHAFIVATFRSASLIGVHFCQANVKTCDFGGANLRNADFRGAALCSTSFAGANLEGTQFAGAYFHSYTFKEGEKPDSSRSG